MALYMWRATLPYDLPIPSPLEASFIQTAMQGALIGASPVSDLEGDFVSADFNKLYLSRLQSHNYPVGPGEFLPGEQFNALLEQHSGPGDFQTRAKLPYGIYTIDIERAEGIDVA